MRLRIDYDKFTFRMVDTVNMLKSISMPYDVRISASGTGLHICKDGSFTYDDPLYIKYDDPRRLRMNRIRRRAGVSHNLLWNKKKGSVAREWHRIDNLVDILSFTTRLFEVTETYIYSPTINIIGGNHPLY